MCTFRSTNGTFLVKDMEVAFGAHWCAFIIDLADFRQNNADREGTRYSKLFDDSQSPELVSIQLRDIIC